MERQWTEQSSEEALSVSIAKTRTLLEGSVIFSIWKWRGAVRRDSETEASRIG